MVVIGCWPYVHTLTLSMLNRVSGKALFYLVDEDTLISEQTVEKYNTDLYVVDREYWIVSSKQLYKSHIEPYLEQVMPPEVPTHISELITKHINPSYTKHMDGVVAKSLLCMVDNNSKSLMDDIGAQWNSSIGVMICDGEKIRAIKQAKSHATSSKVEYTIMFDDRIKLYGNVSPHVELLKSLGATHNDKEGAYYLDMDKYDKVAHLIS